MKTIRANNHWEIIEKKSQFICYLYRIKSEEEAQEYIKKIKKEHHKARHHCYAYILDDFISRSSDDGEPSGTAGIPILETLKQMELKETLAIVVRYFGGIKLGTGGLIRAYREATSHAIKKTGIVKIVEKQIIQLKIDYNLNDKLNYFLQLNNIPVQNIDYTDQVNITIIVDDLNNLKALLDQNYYNEYQLTNLGPKKIELPLK